MGNSPTVEVYLTSDDVVSGDVVGFFCGPGNQGRIRSKPVPNLKVPGFKKKDILADKDLEKFGEIDEHALHVRYYYSTNTFKRTGWSWPFLRLYIDLLEKKSSV